VANDYSYNSDALPTPPVEILGTADPDSLTITVVSGGLVVDLSPPDWVFVDWSVDDQVIIDGSGRLVGAPLSGHGVPPARPR